MKTTIRILSLAMGVFVCVESAAQNKRAEQVLKRLEAIINVTRASELAEAVTKTLHP